jgi:hypothetical protein
MWAESNITNAQVPSTGCTTAQILYDNSTNLIATKQAYQNQKTNSQNALDDVFNAVDVIKGNFTELAREANAIVRDVVFPLIANVSNGILSVKCGFVGKRYSEMKAAVCVSLVKGIGGIAMAFFLIIVFSIPLLIIMLGIGEKLSKAYDEFRTNLPPALSKIAPPPYTRPSEPQAVEIGEGGAAAPPAYAGSNVVPTMSGGTSVENINISVAKNTNDD